MIALLIITSFIFIWSNHYYILNKNRLDSVKFGKNKTDLIYYSMVPAFWLWLIFSYTQLDNNIVNIYLVIYSLKFIFFHLNKKISIIWNNILPIITILLVIIIDINYILNFFK